MTPVRLAAATTRRLRLLAPAGRLAPAGLLALALATSPAPAQTPAAPPTRPAAAATAPIDPLMEPGPLPDIVQGSAVGRRSRSSNTPR